MDSNTIKTIECRRLWKEVFGDSDEFITSFIKSFYSEENMLCIERDSRVVSMLHVVPFELDGKKVAYIYAVATDADARGQGLATKLIRQAIEKTKAEGYKAVFTLPADEGLREFYSRFGFKGRYAVKFETKEDFDFGTGESEKDYVMMLSLENGFAVTEEEIILKKDRQNLSF